VATDGSKTAAEAVRVATELAIACGASLHIANIYRAGGGSGLRAPEMKMALPEGIDRGSVAATQTEAIAAHARTKGLTTKSHVMPGDPVEQILAIASEQKIDVIVVGNKGMRGAKRILGSVPNGIAHRASCAVLIVNTT
jgi:nucleotide-binding universal stress UspA family protein